MDPRNLENTQRERKPANLPQRDPKALPNALPRPLERSAGPHRLDGTLATKNIVPASSREQCIYLERMAHDVISHLEMPLSELKDRENLRTSLFEICKQVIEEAVARLENPSIPIHASLNCFGSLRAGIALRGSDVDLILKVTNETNHDMVWELDIPRLLEKRLLAAGYGARLLTTPRVAVLKTCSQPGKELRDSLQEELEWSQSSLSKLPDPSITISSLRRPDARLDKLFTAAMRDGHFSPQERDIILQFQTSYRKAGKVSSNPELCAARSNLTQLPTILDRYSDPQPKTPADFPTHGVGIKGDIVFSGDLAQHNSQLVRCYTRCDERLRHMIIFVKAWANNRGINSPFQGTLCSYGYVLMVLHFAINIASPPLCLNLQHQLGPMRGGAENTPRHCNGYNVQFWRDEKQVELAAMRGMLTYNNQSLGSLLREFFLYYGDNAAIRKRFRWEVDTISIRSTNGIVTKAAKNWTSGVMKVVPSALPGQPPRNIWSSHLLAIEDPFETDHNVARTVSRFGVAVIRDEFRRAYRLIQHAGHLGGDKVVALMEAGEEKVGAEGNRLPPSGSGGGTLPAVRSTNTVHIQANPRDLKARFSEMGVK